MISTVPCSVLNNENDLYGQNIDSYKYYYLYGK